jgi:hypothetical protein
MVVMEILAEERSHTVKEVTHNVERAVKHIANTYCVEKHDRFKGTNECGGFLSRFEKGI